MKKSNFYKSNTKEHEFILWELYKIEEELLDLSSYDSCNKEIIQSIIEQAKQFAYETLGPNYQTSDLDSCHKVDDKQVAIPGVYQEMWQAYCEQWSGSNVNKGMPIPAILQQVISEIFMGANPSFMTYSGFCHPAINLIRKYGNQLQKDIFTPKLATFEWAACLCLTESHAGSDISTIKTFATKKEDGKYLLQGTKAFISAGMHELTDNIMYFVLARTSNSDNNFGLSCFLVPRYKINDQGEIVGDNNVRCDRVVEKMGFRGCANTDLKFGESGDCEAYLLGERENIGLSQLMSLMNQARISTGCYALGMASSAYLNSVDYANKRIQGKKFMTSYQKNSKRVPIIEHWDVQRMLQEMKCKVDGFRMLILRLKYYESLIEHYDSLNNTLGVEITQKISGYQSLCNLLTPLVKAYITDESWRVCELAIQIHGGNGYTIDFPLEQYARDVKVLSIWEGTNYIQSQDLIHNKLSFGRNTKALKLFLEETESIFNEFVNMVEMRSYKDKVVNALNALEETLSDIADYARNQEYEYISACATSFLRIFAKAAIAVFHYQAACVAKNSLNSIQDQESVDACFYKGKISSANYFIDNVLPEIYLLSKRIKDKTMNFENVDIFKADYVS